MYLHNYDILEKSHKEIIQGGRHNLIYNATHGYSVIFE